MLTDDRPPSSLLPPLLPLLPLELPGGLTDMGWKRRDDVDAASFGSSTPVGDDTGDANEKEVMVSVALALVALSFMASALSLVAPTGNADDRWVSVVRETWMAMGRVGMRWKSGCAWSGWCDG